MASIITSDVTANGTKESAKVVKAGYLTKLGRRDGVHGKSWKARYFVLLQLGEKALLYYYLDEKSYRTNTKEKGCIDLLAASVIQKMPAFADKIFAFEISTPTRTLLVYAENKEEELQWVRQIAETAEMVTKRFINQHQKQEEEEKRLEAAAAVAAKENEQKEQTRLRRELEEAKKAIDKAKQEEVEAAERARIQALEEKEVKVAAATAAVKEAAEKAKEEAETARASIERARVEALKQSLLKKAHNGFICMKKLKTEVKFRSPRYVWCDNGEIRWSKGREKNEKKGHYKSMLASDVISIIPAENEIEDEKNKKNIKKKKRGSIFAGALDSSELVETITEEAVLYVVSRKGDHFTLALHLSPTASKSSLQGAVAKRRNELVEILRAFVNDNVENSGSNGSNRETKE
jgi:hypothetical protein